MIVVLESSFERLWLWYDCLFYGMLWLCYDLFDKVMTVVPWSVYARLGILIYSSRLEYWFSRILCTVQLHKLNWGSFDFTSKQVRYTLYKGNRQQIKICIYTDTGEISIRFAVISSFCYMWCYYISQRGNIFVVHCVVCQ